MTCVLKGEGRIGLLLLALIQHLLDCEGLRTSLPEAHAYTSN